MLETFCDRLRHLCPENFTSSGRQWSSLAQIQAQQALVTASELGLLIKADVTWDRFKHDNSDLHYGTEHVVESTESGDWVAKITILPAFGLAPRLIAHPNVNLRDDPTVPSYRQAIEFLPATPIEYLQRWIAAKEVFEDAVRLTSVVQWADGLVSFGISQPQYHGEAASPRDIDRYFEASGWTRVRDPGESGHVLYFNYAFQVLAIDALPRNCYLHDDELLPFDVILSRPDESLEKFLQLYPD
ncbi:hypothetical protein EI77_00840 [Prosthecobacter fusiformis]|uniref:Uncharacterized protein n=1 Tax=Prosthecobacter fusiformis TaxID=48464 RepID=A0A4R7SQK4_9BACT|nr:hypothetical protein [Prosthecobacter fusiformis]TDU81530.1 hypothetical protein EI77_00840 [Prosthecobacter fusiformis]